MSPLGGTVAERDLQLSSGRMRIRHWEGEGSPVVCIPGLSANLRSFDRIAARLSSVGREVVAVDLRGRGRSEVTPAGTYGWPAHAEDVAELAGLLGHGSIDVVGHSMGAYVAMQLARDRPALTGRIALIDGAGAPETAALRLISAGLGRLDRWHPSEDSFVEAVRSTGVVVPWDELWDSFYRYELERRDDGRVRSTTSLAAALEDLEYGERHRHDALWEGLRGPVLLLRATVPLGDGGGFIVSAADGERFPAVVPGAEVVAVAANHFGIVTHPTALAALAGFLGGDPAAAGGER